MGQRIGGLKVYPSERISRFMLRERGDGCAAGHTGPLAARAQGGIREARRA